MLPLGWGLNPQSGDRKLEINPEAVVLTLR